jgi:hypothetical protein
MQKRMWIQTGAFLSTLLVATVVSLPSHATPIDENDLVLFPIGAVEPGATVVSTDQLIDLFQGEEFTYAVNRIGVQNPSGNNPDPSDPSTWTILSYEGTVTYLPGGPAPAAPELDLAETLVLAFTSLREGPFDGSTLPPRIDGGYVLSSFSGLSDAPFYIEDPTGGMVVDEEGDLFLALAFAALPGVSQTFGFEIALREPLDDTLQQFNRGFAAPIPEPSSAALLLAAFGGLLIARHRIS